MSNPYQKDFDTLLTEILTDYKNLDSAPDVSQGSITFIKGAVLASALWGLYKYQDWILKQVFPDTADTDGLNHSGIIYGVARISGETDADYAKRMIGLIQNPPAGGTQADYLRWSQAATPSPGIPANIQENFLPTAVSTILNTITLDGTTNALGWVNADPILFQSTGTLPAPLAAGSQYYAQHTDNTTIRVALTNDATPITVSFTSQGTGLHTISHYSQGNQDPNMFFVETSEVITPNSLPNATQPGTVNVILVPDDESILDPSSVYYPATNSLTVTTKNYIESVRPVTANVTMVAMETLSKYDFVINAGPINVDILKIAADLQSYVNSLLPGQVLYSSQLTAIALYDGAAHAEITSPTFTAGQIIPDSTSAIRVKSIVVNPEA